MCGCLYCVKELPCAVSRFSLCSRYNPCYSSRSTPSCRKAHRARLPAPRTRPFLHWRSQQDPNLQPAQDGIQPVVLPEPFNAETPWNEWSIHFGNVADVNRWDAGQKLQWLKLRLTGCAQKAFQRLPEASRATSERSPEGEIRAGEQENSLPG